jgi:hypothetical protein
MHQTPERCSKFQVRSFHVGLNKAALDQVSLISCSMYVICSTKLSIFASLLSIFYILVGETKLLN